MNMTPPEPTFAQANALKPSLVERMMQVLGAQRVHFFIVVWLLVNRDLKLKYRGSALGYLWSMLNPMLFMLVISFVFSHIVRGIPNYPLFVLSGILMWSLASISISAGTNAIVNGAHLLRKVRLPIWVFPAVPLGTCAVNYLLSLIPFSLIAMATGSVPTWRVLLLPVLMAMFMVFLGGVALTLATLNVFFRDVGHVLDPLLSLVFYATPVIYDRHQPGFPEKISLLLSLNPFTHFIELARYCLLPNVQSGNVLQALVVCLLAAAGSTLVASVVYRKAKPRIMFSL
jgi:ABC-type polysaccharide/polyol phosphate export permease